MILKLPFDIQVLWLLLGILFVIVLPAVIIVISTVVGQRLGHRRRGLRIGIVIAALLALTYLYGTFIGSRRMEVKQWSYAHKDVPEAFRGYRIVQWSDAHVGSFVGCRQSLLKKAVDMINAQRPDLVVFTGDLQNRQASEIDAQRALLSAVKARDGVVAVLGNHDYAEYVGGTEAEKARRCAETVAAIERLGWTLLRNEHLVVRRGNDSIVVAGMENDGVGRFPHRGDIDRTLRGVGDSCFILMLEHDPTSWRRTILPRSKVQLTLSGHTHGGQLSLFGWSPASMLYPEYSGEYREGSRTLFVSNGLGGAIPFRLGTPGEIVVITLTP